MWKEVLERFESQAPVSVMARVALEQALPAQWIDEVFEAKRQRQYPRELLMSTVVELMMLVSLGLRPSLHAAAKKMVELPVTLAALYDKVNRTEPQILRALVQGSAARLAPVVAAAAAGQASLAGWRLRIIDGNHLPASEKRLAQLRSHRGAAMPGHTLVVYDPDSALVTDILACEDAHESERVGAAALLQDAQPGELWIADRHFCTRTLLQGWQDAQAGFIVREHARHPRLLHEAPWHELGPCETGQLYEQAISIHEDCSALSWRRIRLVLDSPTEAGEQEIRLWSNLPPSVTAEQIAQLYRKRWRIEGLFGRLESVLDSEIRSLGHPRAALLGFASAVLAFNVLALLKRCIEQAHRKSEPELDVSTYHLSVHVASDYQGMLIAVQPQAWRPWSEAAPARVANYLLSLALNVCPRSVTTAKRGPKKDKPGGYVPAAVVRKQLSTARLLRARSASTP
jgi:IS4 transposase